MSLMPWEMEVSDDGDHWRILGFATRGGFNPYRYEFKRDAEYALNQMHPSGFRRVVRARSMTEMKP